MQCQINKSVCYISFIFLVGDRQILLISFALKWMLSLLGYVIIDLTLPLLLWTEVQVQDILNKKDVFSKLHIKIVIKNANQQSLPLFCKWRGYIMLMRKTNYQKQSSLIDWCHSVKDHLKFRLNFPLYFRFLWYAAFWKHLLYARGRNCVQVYLKILLVSIFLLRSFILQVQSLLSDSSIDHFERNQKISR